MHPSSIRWKWKFVIYVDVILKTLGFHFKRKAQMFCNNIYINLYANSHSKILFFVIIKTMIVCVSVSLSLL